MAQFEQDKYSRDVEDVGLVGLFLSLGLSCFYPAYYYMSFIVATLVLVLVATTEGRVVYTLTHAAERRKFTPQGGEVYRYMKGRYAVLLVFLVWHLLVNNVDLPTKTDAATLGLVKLGLLLLFLVGALLNSLRKSPAGSNLRWWELPRQLPSARVRIITVLTMFPFLLADGVWSTIGWIAAAAVVSVVVEETVNEWKREQLYRQLRLMRRSAKWAHDE